MGVIWRAHDALGEERVAIKTLLSTGHLAAKEALFAREQRMQQRLSGVANVPKVVECGRLKSTTGVDLPYIAMEWLSDARSLRSWWCGRSLQERLRMLARLCRAVDSIHEADVLHCDLKPDNIIIDQSGSLWVVDLGLAESRIKGELAHAGWEIGQCRGTFNYMSPEQCDQACDAYHYTPALDVYALGVIAHECITGALPYAAVLPHGASIQQARAMIRAGAVVRRRSGGVMLHPEVRRVLARALAPDPSYRYQSAGELAEVLERIASRSPVLDRRSLAACIAAGMVTALMASVVSREPKVNGIAERLIATGGSRAPRWDHTLLLTLGENTPPDLLEEQLRLEPSWGLGEFQNGDVVQPQARRPVIARLIDALREREASVVFLDMDFAHHPGSRPELALILRESIERFEAGPGRVVIGELGLPRSVEHTLMDPNLHPHQRAWGLISGSLPLDSTLVRMDVLFKPEHGAVIPSAALRAAVELIRPGESPRFELAPTGDRATVRFEDGTTLAMGGISTVSGRDMLSRESGSPPGSLRDVREGDHFAEKMILLLARSEIDACTLDVTEFLRLPVPAAKSLVRGRAVVVGFTDNPDDVHTLADGAIYGGYEVQSMLMEQMVRALKGQRGAGPLHASWAHHAAAWIVMVTAGAWLGRLVSTRRRTGNELHQMKHFSLIMIGAALACLLACLVSRQLFYMMGWIWNPLAGIAGVFVAAGASGAAPWLMTGRPSETRS